MNLLQNKMGRNFFAFAFYFAEGAPIGFIWWAMPTILRNQGASTAIIGSITAAILLPWIFKFLWAPLVDVYRSKHNGFKKWIAFSQAGMCFSLLLLLFVPLKGNYTTWGIILFVHAVFAATQDVSVDALMIRLVSRHEKGVLNGYMQAGMLLGRSLFGGGFLLLVGYVGINVSLSIMISVILLVMLLLLKIKEPVAAIDSETKSNQFRRLLFYAFRNRQTWFGIGFALTAAAAFEAAGAFAGPLMTDNNISQEYIGFFYAVPVVLAMLAGGMFGGWLSDKMKRKTALVFYLSGFVVMVLAISIIARNVNVHSFVLMTLYTGMYFFTGMFTAASYAWFMDITEPRLGATQFSTYMAATNGCEAWVVYVTGLVAASYSYSHAFMIMGGVSVAALWFLTRKD